MTDITEVAVSDVLGPSPSGEEDKAFGGVREIVAPIIEGIKEQQRKAGLEGDSRVISTEALSLLERNPWIFHRADLPYTGNMVIAGINPSEVAIAMGQRGVIEKTGGGEVLYLFEADAERSDALGRWLNEPQATFTLNPGNCIPIQLGNGAFGISAGLSTMYRLMEMLYNAPATVVIPGVGDEEDIETGEPNNLIVRTSTVLFPNLILEGKVDPTGMQLSQSAESPLGLAGGYSFTLSVTRMIPSLVQSSALTEAFLAGHLAGFPRRVSNFRGERLRGQ